MKKIYLNTTNWQDFKYKINSKILSKDQLSKSIQLFWEQVVSTQKEYNSLQIQFKVILNENMVRSISYVQTVQIDEQNLLFDVFKVFWDIRHEYYHITPIDYINFTYRFVKPEKDVHKTKLAYPNSSYKTETLNFLGFNLPNTMDITTWGKASFNEDYTICNITDLNLKYEYVVKLFKDYQIVNLMVNGKVILTFVDQMKEKYNLDSFTRIIKSQKYEYLNKEIVIKQNVCKVDFMTKIKRDIFKNNKFLTLDLETRSLNGKMKPYCISIFDGNNPTTFYLSEFKEEEDMLKSAIQSIMTRKYNGYRVYIHNFSYFDSIFLIKILSDLTDEIKPIIRDNKIIDLKFKFKVDKTDSNNINRKYTLYFRDSYLLIPSSLRNLAKQFNVEDKTIFPYLFINQENISLSYKGKVPQKQYFDNITEEEYLNYLKTHSGEEWDLKKESILYCEQDVRTLYLVIDKFSNFIFDLYRLDIHSCFLGVG